MVKYLTSLNIYFATFRINIGVKVLLFTFNCKKKQFRKVRIQKTNSNNKTSKSSSNYKNVNFLTKLEMLQTRLFSFFYDIEAIELSQ